MTSVLNVDTIADKAGTLVAPTLTKQSAAKAYGLTVQWTKMWANVESDTQQA